MAVGIFISYRRDDSRHAAGRLAEHLSREFPKEQLFIDVDSIEPGLDFVRILKEQIGKCDVLLAIIGPSWADTRDETGARRIDNPRDFVRIELETALARDIRVIPVLVDGARMPGEGELPEALHGLANRQAVCIAHERFSTDAESLRRSLSKNAVHTLSTSHSKTMTVRHSTEEFPYSQAISLALAGAFLLSVVPAISLWADFSYRASPSLYRWSMLAGAITIAIVGLVVLQWRGTALSRWELRLYCAGMLVAFVASGCAFF